MNHEFEYLKHQNRYEIERKLLSELDKHTLNELIQDKKGESKSIKIILKDKMKYLFSRPYYEFLDEIQKFTLETMVFQFNGGSELQEINRIVSNLEYLYKLKYSKINPGSKLNREDILEAKSIPIELLIEKTLGKKISRNRMIHCPFHTDNKGSLYIYPKTNSFYCFGCQKGGTPIEFIANFLNCSNTDAIQHLKSYFNS